MKKSLSLVVMLILASTICSAQYVEKLHYESFYGKVVNESGVTVSPSEFSDYLDESTAQMCSFAYKRLKFSQHAAIGSLTVGTVGLVSGIYLGLKGTIDILGSGGDVMSPLVGPLCSLGIVGFYSSFGFSGSAMLNSARLRGALSSYYSPISYSPDPECIARLARTHQAFKTGCTIGTSAFAAGILAFGVYTMFSTWDLPDSVYAGTYLATISGALVATVCSFGLLSTERRFYTASGSYPLVTVGPTPSGVGLAFKF